MSSHHAPHESDDALFENLAGMPHEGPGAFSCEADIPGDDEPLACCATDGSLEHGFSLSVDIGDSRLA
jgi:hypothetical protein